MSARDELIERLIDWAIGEPTQYITAAEAAELADFLMPVVIKHVAEALDAERMAREDVIAPPRSCCQSRRGQSHVECTALAQALSGEAGQ